MQTPVRLKQEEVAKFPRWALFAILVAYALPGLFGRDPWRSDDAIGFGAMWTMARGTLGDWFVLNVVGGPLTDEGPLFYWIGAALIKVFGSIVPPDELARVATIFMQLLAGASVWYTAYLLGRRDEAQPQQFAFGGHAQSRDYGRVLGDSALLFAVATLGLLMESHESSSHFATFAFACFSMFALVRWLDRPLQGAILFGASVAGIALTRNFVAISVPLATLMGVLLLSPAWRKPVLRTVLIAALVGAAPLALWWRLIESQPGGVDFRAAWFNAEPLGLWIAQPRTWIYYARNLPWFVWPVWPIAAIALWTWRAHWRAPHIALPIAGMVSAGLYLAFVKSPGQVAMLFVIPPMLTLAAFGLPVLRRGAANLIDWFALLSFSFFGIGVWACWLIAMTGHPVVVANNIAKLVPGFEFSFAWIALVIALAVTVGWLRAIRWRIVERPDVLWRSTVLSSSGVAFVWTLMVALALPYVDYLKTYRSVSADLARRVPSDACVYADTLGLAQRASFAYFNGMRFGGEQCNWQLRYRSVSEAVAPIDEQSWRQVWESRRPGDRRERLLLYRRVRPAK